MDIIYSYNLHWVGIHMSFIENVNDPYHRGFQSIRPFSEKLRFEILGHF